MRGTLEIFFLNLLFSVSYRITYVILITVKGNSY